MTLPLSIFIITKDEAQRLPATLAAIRGLSDDVVVVDSGSTDGTVEIARAAGARVVHRDWEGFGPQKLYGQSLCRHDWILNLDADEAPLEGALASIRAVFNVPEGVRAAAYALRICYVSRFAKTLEPRPLAPVNVTPRLYDRRRAGFRTDSVVHDKVVTFDGSRAPVLRGSVAHRCLLSYAHMWDKIAYYAALQAEEKFKKGRRPHPAALLWDPPAFFLKYLLLRRLAFVGWEGLVVAGANAAGRALRIGMTAELFRAAELSAQTGHVVDSDGAPGAEKDHEDRQADGGLGRGDG